MEVVIIWCMACVLCALLACLIVCFHNLRVYKILFKGACKANDDLMTYSHELESLIEEHIKEHKIEQENE